MKRAIKWEKPVKQWSRLIRKSKCGRYQIITHSMASGRNGYFNARSYEPMKGGQRIGGRLQETFEDAIMICEQDNDPNWEPDDS